MRIDRKRRDESSRDPGQPTMYHFIAVVVMSASPYTQKARINQSSRIMDQAVKGITAKASTTRNMNPRLAFFGSVGIGSLTNGMLSGPLS